jgi:hypothetical protein
MFGFLRLFLIGFVVLSLLYGLLSIYCKSLTRERLEDEWDEQNLIAQEPHQENAHEASLEARDDYVRRGMLEYTQSIRPKMLLGVYILPMIAFCVIFYTTNFM